MLIKSISLPLSIKYQCLVIKKYIHTTINYYFIYSCQEKTQSILAEHTVKMNQLFNLHFFLQEFQCSIDNIMFLRYKLLLSVEKQSYLLTNPTTLY